MGRHDWLSRSLAAVDGGIICALPRLQGASARGRAGVHALRPEGFTRCVDDPELACHWLNQRRCEFGWTCESLEIVSARACESIYVEVTELDADNTVLGFTNDLTGHVDGGQLARMDFTYTEDGLAARKITRATCNS